MVVPKLGSSAKKYSTSLLPASTFWWMIDMYSDKWKSPSTSCDNRVVTTEAAKMSPVRAKCSIKPPDAASQ